MSEEDDVNRHNGNREEYPRIKSNEQQNLYGQPEGNGRPLLRYRSIRVFTKWYDCDS